MRWCLLMVAALALVGCDDAMVRAAKEAVRHSQKNPDAVKFQDVSHCDGIDGVYGFYNAKDPFGAYGGFKIFLYRDGRLFFGNDPRTNDQLDRCYSLSK